jgi:hypothetical protein
MAAKKLLPPTHPCWILDQVRRLPKICTPPQVTVRSPVVTVMVHLWKSTFKAVAALTHTEEGGQDDEDEGQLDGGAVEVPQVGKHGPVAMQHRVINMSHMP